MGKRLVKVPKAYEHKRASATTLSKGFAVACDDLGVSQRHVVYPGTERFPMRQGATAIGLTNLMNIMETA